jgi:sulfur relay (sulfurtransferase) DsrC/TusE family protein
VKPIKLNPVANHDRGINVRGIQVQSRLDAWTCYETLEELIAARLNREAIQPSTTMYEHFKILIKEIQENLARWDQQGELKHSHVCQLNLLRDLFLEFRKSNQYKSRLYEEGIEVLVESISVICEKLNHPEFVQQRSPVETEEWIKFMLNHWTLRGSLERLIKARRFEKPGDLSFWEFPSIVKEVRNHLHHWDNQGNLNETHIERLRVLRDLFIDFKKSGRYKPDLHERPIYAVAEQIRLICKGFQRSNL